jgi:hypothetical protein
MPEFATGKVLADVVRGISKAKKAVIMSAANKIDSLDMTEVKVNGVVMKLTGLTESPLQTAEVFFTQTAANAVHTGSVTLPAGATLVDIIVHAVALWDSGTSATMKVGDVADDDAYFTAIDLKATDLLAGEGISRGLTGGKEGADWGGGESAGDHFDRAYLATARVISGIITDVNAAGVAGRTRMTVVFSLPTTPVAATVV